MCDETWIFNWMPRGNTESWTQIEVNSHILSRDPEISRQVKKVPPFTRKWSEFTSIYNVIFISGSDTCHIRDSAGADEQGAGWSVTSRHRDARWLIKHRTNQNRALGWWHVMIWDRGFVQSKGGPQTRWCVGTYTDEVLVIFLMWKHKSASSPKRQNKHTSLECREVISCVWALGTSFYPLPDSTGMCPSISS